MLILTFEVCGALDLALAYSGIKKHEREHLGIIQILIVGRINKICLQMTFIVCFVSLPFGRGFGGG